ncbi:hypothetical protein EIN_376290, partial [Entamoeba invadens IP1]
MSHLNDDKNTYYIQGVIPGSNISGMDFVITTRDGVSRPNMVQSNSTVIIIHNKVFETYNISGIPPYQMSSEKHDFMDTDTDVTLVHRSIQDDIIFLCNNSKLNMYNVLMQYQSGSNINCGSSLSGGDNMIAVKGNDSITRLYWLSKTLSLSFYAQVKYPNSTTINNDPIRMNKFNVLYAPITDSNKVQVNSPNDFYKNEENLVVPFYSSNYSNAFYNTLGSQLVYTYGSLVLIGTPFASSNSLTNNGGARLYFDYYLSAEPVRFKLITTFAGGDVSNTFTGWSVGMRSGYVFIGGAVNSTNKGVDINSIMINVTNILVNYCVGSVCACPSGYIFVDGDCLSSLDTSHMILTVCCIGVGVFIYIVILIVLLDGYYEALSDTGASTMTFTVSPSDFMLQGKVCEEQTVHLYITNTTSESETFSVRCEKCCLQVTTNEIVVPARTTEECSFNIIPMSTRVSAYLFIGTDIINEVKIEAKFQSHEDLDVECSEYLLLFTGDDVNILQSPPLSLDLSRKVLDRLSQTKSAHNLVQVKKCSIHPNFVIAAEKCRVVVLSDDILKVFKGTALG